MSSRLIARLSLAGLLLLGALSLRYACVDAGVLTATQASELVPSAQAPLLGPIDEHGRTGWLCRPEVAASAKSAKAAELPAELRP
jgi:hypothetical protein